MLEYPRFIGFHIHRKAKTTQRPQEGSFYHWAVSRTLMRRIGLSKFIVVIFTLLKF